MQKLKNDQWSASPSSVTSFFGLPLTDGQSLSIEQNMSTFTTGICGFGWRFALDVEEWSQSAGSYNLRFDFHLIEAAKFGELSVTVRTEHLTARSNESSYSISSPTTQRITSSKVKIVGTPLAHLGSYTPELGFTGIATIEVKVVFLDSLGFSFPTQPSQKVWQALNDSLTGRHIIDTKFYLPTRRNRDFQATRHRPIFASSALLRGYSSYLDTLLDGSGYIESSEVDLDSDIPNGPTSFAYDYESDSDLDSESDAGIDEHSDNGLNCPPSSGAKDASVPPTSQGASHDGLPIEQGSQVTGVKKQGVRLGRIIFINDTAFTTWKALISYLYNHELAFRPLKSAGKPSPQQTLDSPLRCSPKSMYRLADKIGLPELQTSALCAIRENLSTDNIVEEIFSKYTSRYPCVQEVEIKFLMTQLASPGLLEILLDKLKNLVYSGTLPHWFEALSLIIRSMCGEITEKTTWHENLVEPVEAQELIFDF